MCLIRIFCHGRPFSSQYASFMRCNTSKPSTTRPKMVCFPSKSGTESLVVIKNCDWLVSSLPKFAQDTVPIWSCFNAYSSSWSFSKVFTISSAKNLLRLSPPPSFSSSSPQRHMEYIDAPPRPVFVGSPLCTAKSRCTEKNLQSL